MATSYNNGQIVNGGTLNLPSTSGTLALKSEIPSVPSWVNELQVHTLNNAEKHIFAYPVGGVLINCTTYNYTLPARDKTLPSLSVGGVGGFTMTASASGSVSLASGNLLLPSSGRYAVASAQKISNQIYAQPNIDTFTYAGGSQVGYVVKVNDGTYNSSGITTGFYYRVS